MTINPIQPIAIDTQKDYSRYFIQTSGLGFYTASDNSQTQQAITGENHQALQIVKIEGLVHQLIQDKTILFKVKNNRNGQVSRYFCESLSGASQLQ